MTFNVLNFNFYFTENKTIVDLEVFLLNITFQFNRKV